MAFVVANRVKETSTTSGTGTLNLNGAVGGFQTFVAGVGTTNTTYYAIYEPSSGGWEVGIGTVTSGTPDTLSRTTVFESSNSGNLVNFGSTAKDVICTQPAESLARLDNDLDTNGNDVKFGDADKATFGAGNDLQIYHSSDSVYLDASNAPNYLFITTGTSGFYLMDPSFNILVELIGNGISLNHNSSSKLVTQSTGIDVTGTVVADGLTIDGDINLPDWDFATSKGQLLIGDSDDLQLYHISGNNYIKSTSTLQILTDAFQLFNGNNTELMILATANGSVDLYYDNAKKLETTSTGVDVTGSIASNISINAQTGTTYTTVLADRSKLVTLDNASAVTVTIPPNSSVAYPTGTKIDLLAKGAGQVTVAAGAGVTVNSSQTLNLRAQWSAASVVKLATDTWVLLGDLEAA